MATRAVPGLLAALVLVTTGAAPVGATTPSPHWPGAATRSASSLAAASAKSKKPRLPLRRAASRPFKRTTAPLLIPPATKGSTAIFNGLNQPGLNAADNGPFFQTTPPDTTGSIGPNHYVEMVNSLIGVYNRNNLSPVVKLDFSTWLGTGNPLVTPLCDPQIQWDTSSRRWLYVILVCDFTHHMFLYGWSKTADPSDLVNGWCKFSVATPGVLADYPKLGHSRNYMLVGTNNYSSTGMNPFVTAQITWMRTPLPGDASCAAPSVMRTMGTAMNPLKNGDRMTPTSTPVPVNTSTNADNAYVVSAYDPFPNGPPGVPQKRLSVFHVDGSGVFHPDGDLNVNLYAVPAPAPNLNGSSFGIDTLDGRLTQAVGDPTTGIYTQHTVNGTGNRSKVTWYEIQVVSSVPVLTQQGDIASSTEYVFNGAISPRSDGQGAVIFYNRSSGAIDPVIATQSRMVSTPASQMDPGETVLASSTAGDNDFTCNYLGSGSACRWGDYAGASPDPLSATVVWGSNQYLTTSLPGGNPNWATQNFAIVGPTVRGPAPQSSPRPTPTRSPASQSSPVPSPGSR